MRELVLGGDEKFEMPGATVEGLSETDRDRISKFKGPTKRPRLPNRGEKVKGVTRRKSIV